MESGWVYQRLLEASKFESVAQEAMETVVGYHNGASEYQVHFYDIKVQ